MIPEWIPTDQLTNEEYHAHPAISRSALSLIKKSPLHYRTYIDRTEPAEPTPAMRFGTAVHAAVLEPHLFDQQYTLAPDFSRATKAGKEAWARATEQGKELLVHNEWEAIQGIRNSLYAHPAANQCLSAPGINEATYMAKDPQTGLQLKCRPDRLTFSGWCIDLKTTQDASAPEFARSIAKFDYHVQAAFYLHVIEAATGTRPKGFIFMAVEKTAPYAVHMLRLAEVSIQQGTREMISHLRTLHSCIESFTWPGYSDQVEDVTLPSWAVK
jgi:exodeoxyribonuclease VIII